MTIKNAQGGTPKIQIAKVDSNGNLIEEAYFDIHVAYTTSDGVTLNSDGSVRTYGELIDVKTNVIRGQTENGVLNLTVEDFANMEAGFDITNYTGQVTLNIVEVYVKNGFSLTSESKDITLTYEYGVLVDYTEYTDSEVIVEYLYDSVKDNIYKYVTGEIAYSEMPSFVRDFLENWVSTQMDSSDLSYEDVLGWLKEYIEENDDDIMRTVTTLTTNLLEDTNGDIVQIVVEDSLGNLPNIPDEPEGEDEPEPLFMTVAGYVFLDEHATKASEYSSNGLYDESYGEQLLSGIKVSLYTSKGQLAVLVQGDDEARVNPTMTDENGYYEFKGVDPFDEYYVEFTYNGIEYTTTTSSEYEYNSGSWAVSSKGSELTSDRNSLNAAYSEIGSTSKAYDYYTIESLYVEIYIRVVNFINNMGYYPSMIDIFNEVKANHSDDAEIDDKIAYIQSTYINAYAGYSSVEGGISKPTGNGTYPYYFGERFIINENLINSGSSVGFAGDSVPLIQPGQLQINLGLVERDRTDLSLLTDIVDAVVSMNGYDTIYEMNSGSSSYNQYIYEEDYNYSTTETNDGVAYYTDDEVNFYMTYEATIVNETKTVTALTEVVDYYNSNFSWAETYVTSKGNTLEGYRVTLNDVDITGSVSISTTSKYGLTNTDVANTSYTNIWGDSYKELFITFNTNYSITDGDVLRIYLTFQMDEASATLYDRIYTERDSNDYSRIWEIGNYAEINGYMTEGGYLDADSTPGNFSIKDFETIKEEYQEAYDTYVQNRTSDNAIKLRQALGNLTDVREDDAWYVGLSVANSGYVRELHGSVWEAITGDIKTATDLQNYEGLLEYVEENGLEGLSVELVELCDDLTQIVRGKTTTSSGGDYTFKSYIAGNYAIRFIYGEDNKDIRGKTENINGKLQVNGQYYQSTKANDATNDSTYWYDTDADKRYSDAYDDAGSRMNQINAEIEGTNSTSSDYEYDGVLKVENYEHIDTIYAYTSTLNLEIEYVQALTEGSLPNTEYEYKIENIDFGLTPRANADLNIDKYVSKIMLYLQDGTIQLDATIDKDGNITYANEDLYANTVIPTSGEDNNVYRDGLIEVLIDEELLNGATLEITYTLTVSNDGEYDTIKYIYGSGKSEPVAVAYYGEDYTKLVSYEGDRTSGTALNNKQELIYPSEVCTGEIVYHDGASENYSLEKYASGNDQRIIITTSASNIVDYIDPALNFTQVNKAGESINTDWELTSTSDFNSSRLTDTELMSQYNTIIRASDSNVLCSKLLPGETVTNTLTLTKVLATTSTETNDYEYSNLVELTRINNIAGKVIELEGYDVTGEVEPETSEPKPLYEIIYPDLPTNGTSKSYTIVIHAPTGLSLTEETKTNLGIILVALVVLAGGVFLIKKFVLVPKA